MSTVIAMNLSKRFGSVNAVKDLSFKVGSGEIFGILGPNGSGKTTTLRILSCLISPNEGNAIIGGHNIRNEPLRVREISGVLTENPSLYERLSANENLEFFAKAYGVTDPVYRSVRIKEVLEFFELWDRRGDKVGSYSKGMKQKLAIARAIVHKPEVLFLDEPTSGLDVQSVLVIRDLIRKLNQEGLTIFVTTHNIEEASQICNRVAIINHGKIAAIDTPEKLKKTVRSLQSVEVAFEETPLEALKHLKALPNVREVVKEGDKFRLFTDDPSSVYSSIWDYAQNNHLRLITINTLGPSLEDVFVQLTGITPATADGNADQRARGQGKRQTNGREKQ